MNSSYQSYGDLILQPYQPAANLNRYRFNKLFLEAHGKQPKQILTAIILW